VRRLAPYFFTYAVFAITACMVLLWPLMAWCNAGVTVVDTNYWTVRYMFYFVYIGLANLRLPSIDVMQLLFCDGFVLS